MKPLRYLQVAVLALAGAASHAHAADSMLGLYDCAKGLKQVSGHAVSQESRVLVVDGDNAYIVGTEDEDALQVDNLKPADLGDDFNVVIHDDEEDGEERESHMMITKNGGVVPLAGKRGGRPVQAHEAGKEKPKIRQALKNELLHEGIDLTPGEKARIMSHCGGVGGLKAEMPAEWQGQPDRAPQRGDSQLNELLDRARRIVASQPDDDDDEDERPQAPPPPNRGSNRVIPPSDLNVWLKGGSEVSR